ncbi:H(+)/Cl(-) exchange transporter 3 [Cichlidogyrus casuarinus]|uniref:Chloride channel protein n=1 Tax=Cichlidogyrus casuarinus TaxID=1844966 RepID=A0ABD2Q8U5_9PLAT
MSYLDRTLQEVVYKLVPHLRKCELARRRDFYKSLGTEFPEAEEESLLDRSQFSDCVTKLDPDANRDINLYHRLDEQIYLILEPSEDWTHPYLQQKFICLSAQASVTHLRKFLASQLLKQASRFKEIDLFLDGTALAPQRTHASAVPAFVNRSINLQPPIDASHLHYTRFSSSTYQRVRLFQMQPELKSAYSVDVAAANASSASIAKSPTFRQLTFDDKLPTSPIVSQNKYKDSQYEDFETIDWVKDLARDRVRHRLIHSKHTILDHLRAYWDSGSGWFCVLLIGVIVGIIAGVIDIGSNWLSDIRQGVCVNAFWFNREQCCWSSNTDTCQWRSWAQLFAQHPSAGLSFFVGYLFFFVWALLFAGLCVLLVKSFAPYACGSGIPEIKTILSGFIIRGYLGKWTLLIKSIGMILGVAAGLSLGKEGPMVHMASCCGNIISYLFPKYGKNEAKKREILSASAAAGVAVAFGAPIGGVLFSLEEASFYFPLKTMFRSFFCAMVSANVLRMMNPNGNEHLVMFSVDYKAQWHVAELIPFALLGMLGGVFGTVFNKANLWVCRRRKETWWGNHPVREVLIVTSVTALVSFPHEYLRMNTGALIKLLVSKCPLTVPDDPTDIGYSICDYMTNITDTKYQVMGTYPAGPRMSQALGLLAVALIVKGLITVFTFGIKLPTGLFIPSLAFGAIMGRMLGVSIEQLVVHLADNPLVQRMCKKNSQPCINPGLYAMVGAAASLGGVTRMTISLVVIMLELTGGLTYIIPLMVATLVSKWTGDWLTNGSIYEEHIRLNKYPYLSAHDELAHDLVAADVMACEHILTLVENGMTIHDIQQVVNKTDVKGYPVVASRSSQKLMGWVTRRDLIQTLEKEHSFDPRLQLTSKVSFADSLLNASMDSEVNSADLESEDVQMRVGDTVTIHLRDIVDFSPITVADQTSMETVINFFRKLGLRQVLVTRSGNLLGIITKKDILNKLNK